MIPLGLLSPGELGEIVEVRSRQGGCSGPCHDGRGKGDVRVEDMGLRVGNRVEMLNNGGGPVLVKVDESRIAVDRGMAMKIMVRSLQ
ncbi:FeoA family protein [Geobacter sp.]|uniref:FeoA family protein n=1 Tax=Geobacter sp. TaxID=46610 RepID=UPI0027B9A8FE|nr:FeoA family protein [Geobacter sp.]